MAFSAGNTAMSEPQFHEKKDHFVTEAAVVHPTGPGLTPGTSVTFEEYLYQAAITRRIEDEEHYGASHLADQQKKSWFFHLSDHKGENVNMDVKSHPTSDTSSDLSPDDIERLNASRALRMASWASVFYLITTDILGPFNAPYAISQVGWTPGKPRLIDLFLLLC